MSRKYRQGDYYRRGYKRPEPDDSRVSPERWEYIARQWLWASKTEYLTMEEFADAWGVDLGFLIEAVKLQKSTRAA